MAALSRARCISGARSIGTWTPARDLRSLPAGWRLFLEHKLFEPAFYSTVLNDWGTATTARASSGPRVLSSIWATTRRT